MIELEDHAELAIAQRIAAAGGKVVDTRSVVVDLARVRPVQQSQQVQQRTLARAAGADDRDELAGLDVEIDVFEDGNLDLPFAIAFAQCEGLQPRRSGRAASASAA